MNSHGPCENSPILTNLINNYSIKQLLKTSGNKTNIKNYITNRIINEIYFIVNICYLQSEG